MNIVYSIISVLVAGLLVGSIHDYSITLQNLFTVVFFSWLLYPLVKTRVLDVLRWVLQLVPREEK